MPGKAEAPNETGPHYRQKSAQTVETIKNAADALKSLIIIGAILLVVFGSSYVEVILNHYNVSKLDFGGVTIDRSKAIESLATNADRLPQAESALKQSTAQLLALRNDYARLSRDLTSTRSALALAQAQLANSSQATAARTTISGARRDATAALSRSRSALITADQAIATTREASAATTEAVRSLPRPSGALSGFAVVFGGDATVGAARDQAGAARTAGLDARIYRRQGSYRSVGLFPDRASATGALSRYRALNRYSADAYVVSLSSWCPSPTEGRAYSDCGF